MNAPTSAPPAGITPSADGLHARLAADAAGTLRHALARHLDDGARRCARLAAQAPDDVQRRGWSRGAEAYAAAAHLIETVTVPAMPDR